MEETVCVYIWRCVALKLCRRVILLALDASRGKVAGRRVAAKSASVAARSCSYPLPCSLLLLLHQASSPSCFCETIRSYPLSCSEACFFSLLGGYRPAAPSSLRFAMSDHPGNQLVVRDTFFPVCGAEKSFINPSCVLGSPLGGWRNLLADAAPCYGAALGDSEYAMREDAEMASSSLELEETKMIARSLEIMAFGSGHCNLTDTVLASLDCSGLQQSGSNRVFRGSSDCPQLWMHNNTVGPSGPIMPDHTPELSRRLIVEPDATCLASRGLEPASLLAPSSARQALDDNAWSLPMTSLQLRGRSAEPGHGLDIINSQEFISQYSFNPAFAARAAKCASVRREASSDFNNSPTPALDDPRKINCRNGALKNRRPKKQIELASSCSSQGPPSLLSDRRTAKVTLASARDVKARKNEIQDPVQDECTSEAGELVDEDRSLSGTATRLCSPYALVEGKACRSQESEQQTKSLEEATSGTRSPQAYSSGEELEAQDTSERLKRVRTAENEERIASMLQNLGTNAKNGAPVLDSSLKRQKSLPTSKWKEEPKTEDSKQKSDDSGGESSPKAGKFKATKPLEAPKLDYIHVRARRGQATDSHSLAERARREKISERMRFLQDLVPGCSKITGKAMMLDEIINYVQSLQHQVEFLAMKLAALNPRLDFNRDSFLERQFASALDEINGAVPELATSAGPQITTNYHMQMQNIRTIQQRSDEADYGVSTSRDMSTENCNPIIGISHGSSWERNLPYE